MSITKDFNNVLWYEEIIGTGAITIQDSGQSILIESPEGSTARCRYYTIAFAGERLTFTVQARNMPVGGLDGFAGIWIDVPIGTLKNVQQIESEELKVYTVECVVPFHLIGPQKIAFGVGSYAALNGSAEFINPVITRSGTHVVMEGFLQLDDGGGFTLREDYLNYNVGLIEWSVSDQTIEISPSVVYDFQETGGTNQFRPIVQVTGAPDGNVTEVYTWTGSCTGFTAHVKIQACTSTAPVDLNSLTNQTRFVGFRLLMVGDG